MTEKKTPFAKAVIKALAEPFHPNEINWRLAPGAGWSKYGPFAQPLAYLTARSVVGRLTNVFGADWQDSYQVIKLGGQEGMICTLTAQIEDQDKPGTFLEWCHSGCAPVTGIDPIKGAESDSLKRAAVKLMVGRYLHYVDSSYLPSSHISETKQPGWIKHYIKKLDKEFWWRPPSLPAEFLPSGGCELPGKLTISPEAVEDGVELEPPRIEQQTEKPQPQQVTKGRPGPDDPEWVALAAKKLSQCENAKKELECYRGIREAYDNSLMSKDRFAEITHHIAMRIEQNYNENEKFKKSARAALKLVQAKA